MSFKCTNLMKGSQISPSLELTSVCYQILDYLQGFLPPNLLLTRAGHLSGVAPCWGRVFWLCRGSPYSHQCLLHFKWNLEELWHVLEMHILLCCCPGAGDLVAAVTYVGGVCKGHKLDYYYYCSLRATPATLCNNNHRAFDLNKHALISKVSGKNELVFPTQYQDSEPWKARNGGRNGWGMKCSVEL